MKFLVANRRALLVSVFSLPILHLLGLRSQPKLDSRENLAREFSKLVDKSKVMLKIDSLLEKQTRMNSWASSELAELRGSLEVLSQQEIENKVYTSTITTEELHKLVTYLKSSQRKKNQEEFEKIGLHLEKVFNTKLAEYESKNLGNKA